MEKFNTADEILDFIAKNDGVKIVSTDNYTPIQLAALGFYGKGRGYVNKDGFGFVVVKDNTLDTIDKADKDSDMNPYKLKKEIEQHLESKIPKWNGKQCGEGCNCIAIAEAKNNGEGVKNYPCQGGRGLSEMLDELKDLDENNEFVYDKDSENEKSSGELIQAYLEHSNAIDKLEDFKNLTYEVEHLRSQLKQRGEIINNTLMLFQKFDEQRAYEYLVNKSETLNKD